MLQLLARCRLHRGTDDAAAFCNGGRSGAGGRGVGGGMPSLGRILTRGKDGGMSPSFAQIHPRAQLGEERGPGLREPNIAFRVPRRRGVFARSDGWMGALLTLTGRGGGCYDALRKQRSGFVPAVSLFFLVFPPVDLGVERVPFAVGKTDPILGSSERSDDEIKRYVAMRLDYIRFVI